MAPYRTFWLLALLGLFAQLAGVLVDVVLHARDSTLAAREDPLALANPGHALIAAGLALTAFALAGGAAHWLSRRLELARAWAVAFTLGAACTAAALPFGSAPLAEALGGSHEHPAPAPRPDSETGSTAEAHVHEEAATAASAANPDSPTSAHTHGEEVPVTASQLRAAAELVERVAAATKKYEDIRAALADGYVQITQDLPGIAAHFYHPEYAQDGRLLDPERPESLLYAKRLDGTWRLVGVMFTSEQVTDEPPSFFGPLDVWHRHENLCFLSGGRVTVTSGAADCPGLFVPVTPWNLHVWTVEGRTGVFAHDPDLIDPGPHPPAALPAAVELRLRDVR